MQPNLAMAAWLFLGVVWGTNFIFMKWATDLISPSQVVLVRVATGLLPIMVWAAVKRQLRLKHFSHIRHFFVMACLAAAIYYYGFVKGTSLLPSGIAGAISGAIPLFALIVAVVFLPEERLSRHRVAALLVGFLGVFLIAKPFEENIGSTSIAGTLYIIMGSMSLGMSFVYARKFIVPLQIPVAALTTYQLGLAVLVLSVVTDFEGITGIVTDQQALWGLVLGLGVFGTGLAYITYYYIVEKLGAVRASSVTYLPPIVALLIGSVFAGEPITGMDYVAAGLILGGVFLLNRKVKT